jgi:hypothetical protein
MPNDTALTLIVRLQNEATAGLEALSTEVSTIANGMVAKMQSVGASFTAAGEKMVSMGENIQYAGMRMSIGLTAPIVAIGTLLEKAAESRQEAEDSLSTSISNQIAQANASTSADTGLASAKQFLTNKLDTLNAELAKANTVTETAKQLAKDHGAAQEAAAAKIATIQHSIEQYRGKLDLLSQGQDLAGASSDKLMSSFEATAKSSIALGFSYSDSLNSLNALFTATHDVTQATEANRDAMDLARFKHEDLATATTQVNQALQGMGRALTTLGIPIKDGLTPTQALVALHAQLADQARHYAETDAGKMAAAQERINFQMSKMGKTILPIVTKFMEQLSSWLEKVVKWWDTLTPSTQAWIVKGLALNAVLGPILVFLGSITIAIGTLTTAIGVLVAAIGGAAEVFMAFGVEGLIVFYPITIVALALAAIAFLVWKNWGTIKPLLIGLWNDIKFAWNAVIDFLSDKILWVDNVFHDAWQGISDFFHSIWDAAVKWFDDHVTTPIKNSIQAIIDAFNRMKAIVSTPVKIVSNIIGSVGSFVGSALPHFAEGGIVPGAPGQAVPIIAHAGEEVIPANQVGARAATVNVIINNPSVRRDSDISEMRRQIEQLMRPLLLNAKVVHV